MLKSAKLKHSERRLKNLEKMAEDATVDCYNDEEAFAGWACTLEDELPLPLKCKILGQEAFLIRVETDDSGKSVLGVIKIGKKKIRTPIQDIVPVNKKMKNVQLIDAYRHWL